MIIRKGGEYIILKQNILVNTLTNTNFALVFTIYDQLIGRFLPIDNYFELLWWRFGIKVRV
jgi:hypothetical protein